jgi:hypothetical protein
MADGTRRELLRRLSSARARKSSAARLVCASVLGRVLSSCVRRIDAARDQEVPASVAGVLAVPLTLVPELANAGGFVVVHSPEVMDPPLLLINAGSELAWVSEDDKVECPCHGARFARDGTVLHSPAVSNVPTYPVGADGRGNLIVQLA